MARVIISFGDRTPGGAVLAAGASDVSQDSAGLYINTLNYAADTTTAVSLVDTLNGAVNLTCRTSSAPTGVTNVATPGDAQGYDGDVIRTSYYTSVLAAVELAGSDTISSIKALGYTTTSGRKTDFTHNSVTLTHDSDVLPIAAPVEFTSISAAPRVVQFNKVGAGTFGYLSLLDVTIASGPTISGTLVTDAAETPYSSGGTWYADIYTTAGVFVETVSFTPAANGTFSAMTTSASASTNYRVGFRNSASAWTYSGYAEMTTSA